MSVANMINEPIDSVLSATVKPFRQFYWRWQWLEWVGIIALVNLSCGVSTFYGTEKTGGSFDDRLLLRSGESGYHTYRIPAAVVTANGTVALFLEGRKNSKSDFDQTDLLVLLSTNAGQTWSNPKVIWTESKKGVPMIDDPRGEVTMGNPCPVFDEETGKIWLVFSRDNKQVFVVSSGDDGKTWEKPREITSEVMPKNWTYYAPGPGHGLQLKHGAKKGRLLFPSNHFAVEESGAVVIDSSHSVYSDDHGRSWRIGAGTRLSDKFDKTRIYTWAMDWVPQGGVYWHGSECLAAEMPDGRVYLTVRNNARYKDKQAYAWSNDGGETWSPLELEEALPGLRNQASIIYWAASTAKDTGEVRQDYILYSAIAESFEEGRRRLNIYASTDMARNWKMKKTIYAGPAAYSDLCVLADGTVLCFYEGGEKSPYESIRMARFNREWIDSRE